MMGMSDQSNIQGDQNTDQSEILLAQRSMQLPSYDLHPSQINVLKNTNSKTVSKRSDAYIIMQQDGRTKSSKRYENEDMPDVLKNE